MPSNLKRYHTFGHDHFLTFSCYRRLPFLNNDHARTVFLEILEQTRQRHGFYVFGYALMPEHVHLLLSEPKHQKLEDTFRVLKTQTSRKLKDDRLQFWQTRYYDFNVLTQRKFVENLRYIHRNPVTRGLAMEQLSPLAHRRSRTGRDRISLDIDQARKIHTPLIAIRPR